MRPPHKIAVLGGSGKAGKYLIRQILHQGYAVRALARDPTKFQGVPGSPEVVVGDAGHYDTVKTLLHGCDAVISTLGMGNPPSGTSIFSTATWNVLKAMQATGADRYILITGLNVDTPFDKKGPATKSATDWMYKNFPGTTADRQLEYSLLAGSSCEWTLVRLPLIDQTDIQRQIAVSLTDCPGAKISAASLAAFLVGQLDDKKYLKKAPFVADA